MKLKIFTLLSIVFSVLSIVSGHGLADTITKPHTFSAGQVANADHVNANFDKLYDQVNKIGGQITVDAANSVVGIGTDSPPSDVKLEVSESTDKALFIRLSRSNNAYEQSVLFNPPGSYSASNVQWYLGRPANTDHFALRTYDGGTDKTRLIVEDGGDVGIGTTDPGATLHTVGTAILQGNGADFPRLRFNSPTAVNYWEFFPNINDGINGDLKIKNNGNVLVSFNSNGNVGIGIDIPDLTDISASAKGLQISDSGVPSMKLSDTSGTNCNLAIYSSEGHYINGYGNYDLSLNTNNATRMTIDSTGKVGIGETGPSHLLHVNGVARSTQSTWDTASDARVKENAAPVSGSLDILAQLNPVTFEYTEIYRDGKETLAGKKIGFIAQEVEEIIPEMVSLVSEEIGGERIDDFRVLNAGDLIPMLVAAVKDLKLKNDALENEKNALLEDIQEIKTALGMAQ